MKKVIFVIESLGAAGAEKSLITLLNLLDYSKLDVSLQLFNYSGEFMKYIPKEVNLLPILPSSEIEAMSIPQKLLKGKLKAAKAHLVFAFENRQKSCKDSNDVFTHYWNNYGILMTPNPTEYDIAIGYGQRLPTFYVAEKVKAKKKYAWINITPALNDVNKRLQKPIYKSFDKVVCVSKASRHAAMALFDLPLDKTEVIMDIIDPEMNNRLAEEKPEFKLDTTNPIILTVARLTYIYKGNDISLEAAKILRDRGVNFVWYTLGNGPDREIMQQYIVNNHLDNHFILLGTTPNPYPYFKASTIYVQTSRHEGFGISIAEARLMNRPVVTSEFECVWEQMVQGENGIVTPLDPTAIADAIQKLLTDKALYNHIQQYQINEKKGNIEELQKFYKLINS